MKYIYGCTSDLMPNSKGIEIIEESLEEFFETFEPSPDPELWFSLIKEETLEWYEEYIMHGFTPNLLKEYADIMYVCSGFDEVYVGKDAFTASGLEYEEVLDTLEMARDVMLGVFTTDVLLSAFILVHESNMSKLDEDGNVIRNEHGKIMKGNNYRKPYLNHLIDNDRMVHNKAEKLGVQ